MRPSTGLPITCSGDMYSGVPIPIPEVVRLRELSLLQHLGDAEIGQHGLAGIGDQDVGGFDIAVDDALLVGVIQGAGHRREEPGGLRPGDGCANALFQRSPRG